MCEETCREKQIIQKKSARFTPRRSAGVRDLTDVFRTMTTEHSEETISYSPAHESCKDRTSAEILTGGFVRIAAAKAEQSPEQIPTKRIVL